MTVESEEFSVTTAVEQVCGWIGHRLAPQRLSGVEARIRRLIARRGLGSVRQLLDQARFDPAAFDELVEEFVVTETYFFRDPDQFEAIRRVVLPDLAARRPPPGELRIWSAGCSTGEEAYSLAMLLEQEDLTERARVLATDLSRRALAAAVEGVYSDWSLRGDSGELPARYFQPQNGRWRVADRLRSRIRFERHNLTAELYPAPPMDLIVCRNVLIYFAEREIVRIGQKLHSCLAPGGWLVLGPSDPPLWQFASFEPVLTGSGVLLRRREERPSGAGLARAPAAVGSLPQLESSRLAAPEPPHDVSGRQSLPAEPARQGADGRAASPDPRPMERVIEEAVSGEPSSAQLHHLHAAALLEGGKLEEAAHAARRAIFLDPALLVAHLMLGAIMQRAGRPAEALRALRRAEALATIAAPEDVPPFSNGETAAQLLAAARSQIDYISAGQRSS